MVLLLYFAIAFIQISPGELSNAHKELEGLANCLKCHSVGEKVNIEKCLACHVEIEDLIKNALGFHYYVRDKNYTEFHKEHFGRNFKIVKFNKDLFKHSNTSFPLLGIHAKLQCSECHNSKFIPNEKFKSKETYLGLSSKCVSCHKNENIEVSSTKIVQFAIHSIVGQMLELNLITISQDSNWKGHIKMFIITLVIRKDTTLHQGQITLCLKT